MEHKHKLTHINKNTAHKTNKNKQDKYNDDQTHARTNRKQTNDAEQSQTVDSKVNMRTKQTIEKNEQTRKYTKSDSNAQKQITNHKTRYIRTQTKPYQIRHNIKQIIKTKWNTNTNAHTHAPKRIKPYTKLLNTHKTNRRMAKHVFEHIGNNRSNVEHNQEA